MKLEVDFGGEEGRERLFEKGEVFGEGCRIDNLSAQKAARTEESREGELEMKREKGGAGC